MLYSTHAFNDKQNNHIDFFLNRLMSTMKSLTSGKPTFSETDRLIQNLENMIFVYEGKKEAIDKIMSCLGKHFLATFHKYYGHWEMALEKKFFTNAYNNTTITLSDYRLFKRIVHLIDHTVALLTRYRYQHDRILYIGCGSIPTSAILLRERLAASIDCIDNDPIACQNAAQILQQWHLSDIHVYHKSCEQLNLNAYDAVIISAGVQNKYLLLDILYEQTHSDCQIICETAYELRSILHEPLLNLYLGKYRMLENYTAYGMNNTISSLLLVK